MTSTHLPSRLSFSLNVSTGPCLNHNPTQLRRARPLTDLGPDQSVMPSQLCRIMYFCTYWSLIGRHDLSARYYCLFFVVPASLSLIFSFHLCSPFFSCGLSLCVRSSKHYKVVCVVVWRGPGGEGIPISFITLSRKKSRQEHFHDQSSFVSTDSSCSFSIVRNKP